MAGTISGLAFIDVRHFNPLKLFKEWQQDVIDAGATYFETYTMCLATATRDGKVENSNVLLRELDDNGFVFTTDERGRKVQKIEENPCVAATFLWNYMKNGISIARQIRIEGKVRKVDRSRAQRIYDGEKLYFHIRSAICAQDEEVDWQTLKNKHDEVLSDVLNNRKVLPMPDSYIGYQIVPEWMDFYYKCKNNIPDRVVFTKVGNEWKFVHVAA